MIINQSLTDQTQAPSRSTSARTRPDSGMTESGAAFKNAWTEATNSRQSESVVNVKRGDTLIGLTKQFLGANVNKFSASEIHAMAIDIAKSNGISNPNKIFSGQQLNLATLTQANTLNMLKTRQPAVESVQINPASKHSNAQLLEQTLSRAVSKGYVDPNELSQIRQKILSLADKHQFVPDDFATMSLMESDGLNPRATNGNCHGIIQFCDGSNRGAASVGFNGNAKDILQLSVSQQLNLVNNYFDQTKLKDQRKGPASLDDLYLTILSPAVRGEKRAHAPLPIAGRQANILYEGRDPNNAITRNSILNGLRHNARQRLSTTVSSLTAASE